MLKETFLNIINSVEDGCAALLISLKTNKQTKKIPITGY